ncbi:MAG TPA: hypothetical protein VNT79_10780 [Phycisphaerae bacterium]|nr:hypothetical protein [Phycisphaerae bacterium]
MQARGRSLVSTGVVVLGSLALSAAAAAQLIIPTAQVRKVYGQATATDGAGTDDTGLIEHEPPPDFFGIWTDPVFGAATCQQDGGGMNFSASYTGGWDGLDTISIGTGLSSASAGGGGPPTCSASGLAGQIFQMSFTLPQNATYSLSYLMGGNSMPPPGGVFYLTQMGAPEPILEDLAAAPDNTVVQSNIRGSLPAGDYQINFDIRTEASFVNGGGGGGGNGINFTFRTYLPGDLNCDGFVDLGDLDPFVLALTDIAEYDVQYPDCDISPADCSGDSVINGSDIEGFVQILLPD